MSGQLMLHCGGQVATIEDLARVDLPERTSSYTPVPHQDLVRLVDERICKEFPGVECEWDFGLNRDGKQFFAVAQLQLDQEDMNMAYAIQNSYDGSLKFKGAGGADVFCCDNLAIMGSSVQVARKHTGNAWEDIRRLVFTTVPDCMDQYDEMRLQLGKMKEIPVTTDRGYEVIGRALGRGILTAQQGSVAIKEWKDPAFDEFKELPENMYRLYNAFTEAGKHGRAGTFMDRYTGFHDFFTPGGQVIH